jgi:hypothetical protein
LYYCIFVNNQKYNNDVELTAELEMTFLNAYHKAALEEEKSFDLNQVKILEYYGTIGKAHVVQFNKVCPGQIQYSKIEGMEFYRYSNPVYLIHRGSLFTIEEAYKQKIINFDNLCRLFGINCSGKDTFNEEKYEKLQQQFKRNNPDDYDMYELLGYYGEYNGHSVVRYNYMGMKYAVTAWEYCHNLKFTHGHSSHVYIVMDGENNMFSLNKAYENGILTLENVIDLFEKHTSSADLSESLFNQTLSYIENMCENYPIEEKFTYGYSIDKYYGQYGDVHIFYLDIIFRAENYDMLEWLLGPRVFDGEKFYKLDEAVELGLITEEIKSQIR